MAENVLYGEGQEFLHDDCDCAQDGCVKTGYHCAEISVPIELKQTRVEPDTPENGYFTYLVMLSALPYVSMPAASSYTMHAKYPLSGSKKF